MFCTKEICCLAAKIEACVPDPLVQAPGLYSADSSLQRFTGTFICEADSILLLVWYAQLNPLSLSSSAAFMWQTESNATEVVQAADTSRCWCAGTCTWATGMQPCGYQRHTTHPACLTSCWPKQQPAQRCSGYRCAVLCCLCDGTGTCALGGLCGLEVLGVFVWTDGTLSTGMWLSVDSVQTLPVVVRHSPDC